MTLKLVAASSYPTPSPMAAVAPSVSPLRLQQQPISRCRTPPALLPPFSTSSRSCRRRAQISCKSTSTGEPKTERNLLDNASNLLTNLLSGSALGSMPTAEGAVSDLFGRPLFALYDWFLEHGPVYKLAFGPKSFVVVSDAVVARHSS